MQFSKDVLASWAASCGFKDRGNGLYRGWVHTSYKDSVVRGMTAMGMTLAATTSGGMEIWASPDDSLVVLVKYS